MKIAVAQINTTVGDFEGNLSKIVRHIETAKKCGADLVVFPELTITSYPPQDLLEKKDFIKKNLETAGRAAKACSGIAAIFGFVSANKTKTGKAFFNSAAFAWNGKIRFVQNKSLLPTYDVFDEARYFEPGFAHKAASYKGSRIGITICEDVWNIINIGGRKLYRYDPAGCLAKDKTDIIINISASPFHVGKMDMRRELLTKTAKKFKLPVIYVNAVGGNDELIFDGRSIVVDKGGRIVKVGKAFAEDFFVVNTDDLEKKISLYKENHIEDLYNALVLGLSDYVRKCGFKKAVIGLSGGIDSAVVAVIAADAIGRENVTGVAMPSPYSSHDSVGDARALARNLKIELETIPIGEVYGSYLRTLREQKITGEELTLVEENIQARVRGNILMAISNRTGALVLSTGNKSELAVGYCTLYGDMAGGLAIIADVPKTMVYRLAEYINRDREKIPRSTIEKPPSAELRPGQKDTDSLPPYDVLDQVLHFYIEEHMSVPAIVKKGFDKKLVADVAAKVDRNEYKRRQAAPGLKLTSKAFAAGRVYPIAWKY